MTSFLPIPKADKTGAAGDLLTPEKIKAAQDAVRVLLRGYSHVMSFDDTETITVEGLVQCYARLCEELYGSWPAGFPAKRMSVHDVRRSLGL